MPDQLSDGSLIRGTCVAERLYCFPATLHTTNANREHIAVSSVKIALVHVAFAFNFEILHTVITIDR